MADSAQSNPTGEPIGKQEAKSLKTRTAICQATIKCLVAYGYGETTISRVVQQANMSNGALLHHFPSKEHLMTATAEYLLGRTHFRPERKVPKGADDSTLVASDLLTNWTYFINTPQYRALLEILIASRTDKRLHDQIEDTLHAYHARSVDHMMATYESASGREEDAELLPWMSNIFFRGLLIQDQYSADPEQQRRMVERWIEMVSPLLRIRDTKDS
jgi:AcrR family transcriptional regulator